MTSRVALTTTPDRAAALAVLCEQLGLHPVPLPCIEVLEAPGRHVDSVRAAASAADLIIVTSTRAVDALWPDGGMPEVPVAAVGRSSADAVIAAGGSVTHVAEGGASELIAALTGEIEGRTVLFPHASGVGDSSVRAMEAAGATVLARPVYEVRPKAPGGDLVEAVVFGSPSAVDGWFLTRDLDGLVVGAIGATTARAVARRHTPAPVVPPVPSFDELIRQLAEHMTARSAT